MSRSPLTDFILTFDKSSKDCMDMIVTRLCVFDKSVCSTKGCMDMNVYWSIQALLICVIICTLQSFGTFKLKGSLNQEEEKKCLKLENKNKTKNKIKQKNNIR